MAPRRAKSDSPVRHGELAAEERVPRGTPSPELTVFAAASLDIEAVKTMTLRGKHFEFVAGA
ncbi:hypothetical protein FOS14_08875 [Skermania sp. ID1734]|uniref:hypothetical protein n=1 Tax=Skermania sp. ID1734 TaxID=2597516 RepID=UPI0011815312|nr:hypothetical protein [Skermania sp. ID1734]TSD99939.1 hypothetical protein FOS14_08875 [Skermania sp. ID1734]